MLIYLVIFRNKSTNDQLSQELNHYFTRNKKIPEFYQKYFTDETLKFNDDLDHIFANNVKQMWMEEYKKNFDRDPPENYEKWLEFAYKKKCPLHPNYYWQLYNDLKPFRNMSISPKMVREAFRISENIGILILSKNSFKVVNSSLNETIYKLNYFKTLFTQEILEILPEREIHMAINYHDYPRILLRDYKSGKRVNVRNKFKVNKCLYDYYTKYQTSSAYLMSNQQLINTTKLLPLFSSCKLTCNHDILIPGFHHIREMENLVEDQVPWEDKMSRFIWRGASTGVGWRSILPNENYTIFPRMRLVKWAMQKNKEELTSSFPVKVDVGFVEIRWCKNKTCDDIKANYLQKKRISYSDHFQSKYLLSIDGHSWVSRFQPFLFSKSLIFQSTHFIEWFSFLVKPWLHYVPIDITFDDLDENIIWAYKNDDKAREMAERASKLAHKFLNFENMQCYTSLLVLEYAQLFS